GVYLQGYTSGSATGPQVIVADQLHVGAPGSTPAPAPVNVAPTASFTATATDLAVQFDAAGSADSDGSLNGHAWDFGDGTTGTGTTASHTYAAAGTY
ncbi:PKD domain-containing protein, partial [uncultured Modestobacter sp.]|uniref:PKD domain-containing protein n=1 Tax=uncultured Modestobacter sp. TaxID=380048 RepID=UPI00262A3F2F